MSDEFNKRLEEIKGINEEAIAVHEQGDPRMNLHDIVMRQWEREHIDWLIEQAEKLNDISNAWVRIEASETEATCDFYSEVQDILSESN